MAPKTVPKRWTAIPGTFGRARTIDWREPDSPHPTVLARQQDQLRAAQMQHDWAWRLTAYRKTRRLSLAQLGELMDMNEQRMGDLLRGDSPAALLDLAAGERALRED